MSSRPNQENACSAPPKTKNRPYDNRPRPARGRAKRRTSQDVTAVRVILPDGPPALTPEAARVLLRILLKAHDRLADTSSPQGGEAE
jgi:hypothetical protein